MSFSQDIDYSRQSIPQSWTDAADEAPGAGHELVPDNRGPRVRVLPTAPIDIFTACFATAAMSMVSGYAWYLLYGRGFTSPWFAVVLGLLIAVTLRLSVGKNDAQTRAVMGVLFYLVTAAVVIFLVATRNYEQLYGVQPTWGQFEEELLHSHLMNPFSLVAWFGGGVVAAVSVKVLR